jgi:hypothetical protein
MINPARLLPQLDQDSIDAALSALDSGVSNEIQLHNAKTLALLKVLDDRNPETLPARNDAVHAYLADDNNQYEDLYSIFKGILAARQSQSDNQPSEVAAEESQKGQSVPLIAGLSAWQLRHFFQYPTELNLNHIAKKYESKKRESTQSSASVTLWHTLTSQLPYAEKWQALVAYCCNPDNKSRRLFKIIESFLKDINVESTCLAQFQRACNLIKATPEQPDDHTHYVHAARILSTIPTRETRTDSPLGSLTLLAALSQIHERTQNYSLALRFSELAHPAESNAFEKKKSLTASCGMNYYLAHFNENPHSRKVKLCALLFAQAENPEVFAENIDSVGKRRFSVFSRSFKAGLTHVVPVATAGAVHIGINAFAPPVAIILTLTYGTCVLGVLAGFGIHGGVHAATRNPLNAQQLSALGENLHKLHTESEETKRVFIGEVVAQYRQEHKATFSNSSMTLHDTLDNHWVSMPERWNSLLYYMHSDINNGKRLFMIIHNKLAERYPAPVSEERTDASRSFSHAPG